MLTQAVESYVAVRRAAGFGLKTERSLLKSFAAFSETRGEVYVRADAAIEWATLGRSVSQRARRLGTVIRFTRYLRAEDERHERPPAVFGAEKAPRPVPYIFFQDQIRQLIDAASRSGYRSLRRDTYSTLFALLACTGLRISEAIRLRLEDITPDGLVIRRSKFRKSRLVPLHDSARARSNATCSGGGLMPLKRITSSCRCDESRSCWRMWRPPSKQPCGPLDCGIDRGVRGRLLTRYGTPSR